MIDIVLGAALLWAAYKGFTKGLIIEIASLVALFLGIYGGIHFSEYAADLIRQNLEIDAKYLPILSFAVTFVGIVLLVFLIAKTLEKVVNLVALKLVNKLAGAFFGMLKMGLILSVVLVLVNTLDQSTNIIPEETKESSILYTPVQKMAPTLIPAISGSDWYEETVGTVLPDSTNLSLPE